MEEEDNPAASETVSVKSITFFMRGCSIFTHDSIRLRENPFPPKFSALSLHSILAMA